MNKNFSSFRKKGLLLLTSGALFTTLTFSNSSINYAAELGSSKNISIANDLEWAKSKLSVVDSKIEIDLNNHFQLDGELKELRANSENNNVVEAVITNQNLILTVKANGTSKITIAAKDELDHSITDTIEVNLEKMGDGDGDGIITSADIQMLNQIISGKKIVSEEEKKKYDIDKDGVITRNDAIKLKDIYLAGPNYTPTFDNYFITLADINDSPLVQKVGIRGVSSVGEVLTGDYQYQDVENDPQGTSTFQWYRGTKADGSDKEAITGATEKTYTLTNDDKDKYVFFEVTPVASAGKAQCLAVVSEAVGKVTVSNQAPIATNVGIIGTTEVGQTVTGQYEYVDSENDAEGTSTFQWYRGTQVNGTDKEAIAGATEKTYTLTNDDKDKYVFFEVTPVANEGKTQGQEVVSEAVGKVTVSNQAPTATNVSISGTTEVGKTLTGQYQYTDAENNGEGTSTFQWYRGTKTDGTDKKVIAGATEKTYKLTADDKDQYVFFEVTPIASEGEIKGSPVVSGASNLVTENKFKLTLVSSTPQDNETNASPVDDFVLTFNEDVIAQDKFIKIFRTADSSLVAIYYVTDTNNITIDHNKVIIRNPGLIQGDSYTIQVPQGTFVDSNGNESAGIEDTTALQFTTINPDPIPFISEYLNGGNGR
ncbi:MAG TPA: Ig-like domain-containing protein, partial [Rummeliibacillus sp.]|nr:Ig-like domain-containing protein [Rummeliibacillus sp.]